MISQNIKSSRGGLVYHGITMIGGWGGCCYCMRMHMIVREVEEVGPQTSERVSRIGTVIS